MAWWRIGSAEAEPCLLKLLDVTHPEEVRATAAEALGRAGTTMSVNSLLEVARSKGTGDDLREAAKEAIGLIQGRAKGADVGQLSLAGEGEAGGELSLAEDEPQRGTVTLETEESS